MTREETRDMVRAIMSLYPSWKPDDLTLTVNVWHKQLKDVDLKDAESRLEEHIQGSRGSFPPNVSELIPKRLEGSWYSGRHYSHAFFEELEKEGEL